MEIILLQDVKQADKRMTSSVGKGRIWQELPHP